jgi:hypothetical protein
MRKNNALLGPNYDFVKRKVPPRERAKGAIASLMVNTNCSIAQNLLTSAAITRDDRTTNKLVTVENSSTTNNGMMKVINRIEMSKINEMKQRGRRFTIEENVKMPIEETDVLKQNGLVTATLLLATTKRIYKDVEGKRKEMKNEANSLPLTLSPDTGSDESSPNKMVYRMPCKISIKKMKRHSLPDTSAAAIKTNDDLAKREKRMIEKNQLRGVLPQFRKREAKMNERKYSPTGLWQKATARAIALRDQFIMSKSSSFGSLSSRKKEKIETQMAENVQTPKREEEYCQTNSRKATPKSNVDSIKERVGWIFDSFDEEEHEKEKEEGAKEEKDTVMNVHFICLTDEIDL